jgi:hypothetical protein
VLVSFFRTGPLRQRILKGFIVAADDPAAVVRAVEFRPPGLGSLRLYTEERSPGTVWLDTGMVWLTDPAVRAGLRRELAQGAVALAAAIRAEGGRLVPGGWLGARGGGTWLCPDLHAVEVLTDTQRELCANLLRSWVPELVAMTGHAAFGGSRVEREGSRRLADAGDQLATRYLASASPVHLGRIRDSLRRDEGVSRLELMDVNPIGLPGSVPNVVVRCIDAQILPATVLAHALIVQAMAIAARKLERDGRRVPAGQQTALDRNRSRAISSGLAAQFDAVTDRARPDRGRNEKARNDRSRPESPQSAPARDRTLKLLEELTPHLQAVRAQADELAPVAVGLTMAGSHPLAVRGETDLLGRWSRDGGDLDGAEFFSDAGWLADDHVTAANVQAYPGAAALARTYWAGRLRPAPPPPPRPPRRSPTEDLFARLGADGMSARDVTREIAAYLRAGGAADLLPALRKLPGDQAKAIRRTLRPARALTRESAGMPADWEQPQSTEVQRLARRDGRALLNVRLTADLRPAAAQTAREHVRRPPDGLGVLLINEASYRDPDGSSKSTIELLLVDLTSAEATVEAAR